MAKNYSNVISKSFNSITPTNILVVLLIVCAFVIGILYTKVQYLEKGAPTTVTAGGVAPTAKPSKVNVDLGHLPIKGNQNAKVSIVLFADFRCPFCEKLFTDVEPQLIKDYVDTGKAKLAFRHYAFLGPASTVAANAAECANEQGKFWDMYDYLYKNQPPESDTSMYTSDKLTPIAGQLGMNTTQFKSCLDSNKYDKNVSDDLAAGQAAGVDATPTVFVDGMPLVGAQPYSAFKSAIDAELNK